MCCRLWHILIKHPHEFCQRTPCISVFHLRMSQETAFVFNALKYLFKNPEIKQGINEYEKIHSGCNLLDGG